MPNDNQKLSTAEKLAYGVGDAAANFVFQTQITFLMFFYTNVFGIAAGVAGTILLISRVIDAFNDPIVGALADRTNTRWGHYRPWVLWSAVPMAIALVLCYTTPALNATGKIVWAIATYNILMVIYAANNIPYCALSGVMTGDSHERTSLASWRFVCAMAAALVVNMFTLDFVQYFGRGDAALGYQLTMAVWGTLAVVFFLITFAFTKERIAPSPKHRSSVRQDLLDLFRNGPWIALFTLAVLIYVQLALRGSAMLYYFKYYLQLENIFEWIDNFGLFNGVGLAFTILGVALSKPLGERFGKRTTFRVCLLLSAVFMTSFAIVPPDSFSMLLTLQVLLQMSFGPTIPILWAMMADVADYSEWQTGRRSTALAFASIVFGLKLGFGIGGWLNGELLEYFGYSATAPLSSSASHGLVMMVSVIPAAVLLFGIGVLFTYRLDDRLVEQIEQALIARRNERDLAPTISGT
jgi:GPH family glycoside/pentoside/hexuronide:cation symporter